MFLAKVIGAVVSTQKEDALSGQKLLILRPMLVDEKDPTTFRSGVNTVVAVDNLGAGEGEMVLFAQGSSARQSKGLRNVPVDAAVVGIVDEVNVFSKKIYKAQD